MNKRLLSIIIAAVMALLAVVMINVYLNREKEKYKIEHQMVPIVVAKQNIAAGDTIQSSWLEVRSWPSKYLQPKVLQNPQAAVGKIALGEILAGEQILDTKLTMVRRTQDSLDVRLPQGKRAYSIKFDNAIETAVANQIKVGNRVDIIGVFPMPQIIDGKMATVDASITLFQNILVMGTQPAAEQGATIFTFALTPEEAAILTYARRQGNLRLVLRHPLDTSVERIPMVETNVLWQYILSNLGQQLTQEKQKPQEKPPEPEPSPTMEIYRGTKRERIELNR